MPPGHLATRGSTCALTLTVNGSGVPQEGIHTGPVLCEQGNALQCYQPSLANSLNITKSNISNHTVGGSITGLTGTVTLLNNGTNSTPISTDGNFTFSTAIAEGSTYAVTVETQPVDKTCTVVNGSGTMGDANVTNVTVTCSTNAFRVGGSVTGLTGTVTLLNNDTNSTPISTDDNFTFSTAIAEGSTYAVTVKTQPVDPACTVLNGSGTMGGTNVTNVTVTCASNNTTLSVSATGTIPVNNSISTFTVTNTGTTHAAYNVHAVLPGGWTGVTQDSSNCTTIAPNNGTCTLIFSSVIPYVAQGNITITGDNISSPPTTALAFTATTNNYLIWAISGNTVQVIDTGDLPSSRQWASYEKPAIGPGAQSLTNGPDNTTAIVSALGTSISYAAESCNQSTNGGASTGDWYLPAICQMASAGQGAGCSSGLANIGTNLVQLGFGELSDYYWSSTEYSDSPKMFAWGGYFNSELNLQFGANKASGYEVRCSRALTP